MEFIKHNIEFYVERFELHLKKDGLAENTVRSKFLLCSISITNSKWKIYLNTRIFDGNFKPKLSLATTRSK